MCRRMFSRKFSIPSFVHDVCQWFKTDSPFDYRYMDYVFGNETEARTFAKVHGWEVIISWFAIVDQRTTFSYSMRFT